MRGTGFASGGAMDEARSGTQEDRVHRRSRWLSIAALLAAALVLLLVVVGLEVEPVHEPVEHGR